MPDVEWPPGVHEFLRTRDQLARAELRRDDAGLDERLHSVAAVSAAEQWVTTDEALEPQNVSLTLACLELLAAHPEDADPAHVRGLVVADSAMLRRAAYEVLFARHFRTGEREAIVELVASMLRDPSDQVRVSAVAYIRRADLADSLRPLLRRWLVAAADRRWQETSSYELASRMVEGGD